MNLVRNQRGQVAIFIAFIFQILFVFFAMLVNVGLLVHHKINLQNSADMAAYYGAMKQAEILNAMAHVNYQIRQSWKLLSWRYRVLGTLGDVWLSAPANQGIHPALWIKSRTALADMGPFADEMSPLKGTYPNIVNPEWWYLRPTFCVAHVGFADWPASENLCKLDNNTLAGGNFSIVNPTPPPVQGGLIGSGVSAAVGSAIATGNNMMNERCIYSKYTNYYLLGLFAVSFQMDVAVRRATFKKLYSLLTNDGPGSTQGFSGNTRSTFRDLNGEDVAKGVLETLKRNLTEPNRASLQSTNYSTVKTYNGLSDPNCAFDQAFTENYIFPHLYYSSSKCTANASQSSDFFTQHLSINPESTQAMQMMNACNPNAAGDISKKACEISQYIYQTSPAELRMSLGFNRDHRCSPYYAIRVQSAPSIPFLPSSGVNLVAESYTQAFGGSMGPWWGQQPDSGNASSLTDERVAKKDVAGPGGALTITNSTEAANYSKYPGDTRGLQSPAQLTFYALELINRLIPSPTPFRISDWDDLFSAKTYLSKNSGLRELEMTAIAPDLYDTTYYSIEPDFYRQYYLRMIAPNVLGTTVTIPGWGANGGAANFDIRPDLGSEKDASGNYPEFSVRNQLEVQEKLFNAVGPGTAAAAGFTNPRARMAGSLASQANTLTSWNVYRIGDYTQDTGDQTSAMWTQKFGRCEQENGVPVTNSYKAVPNTVGNCLSGGRTGFSVRIVSKKYLTDSLDSLLKNRLPSW